MQNNLCKHSALVWWKWTESQTTHLDYKLTQLDEEKSTGKISLFVFVSNTINSVLLAFKLSLLESIQFLISFRQLFSLSIAEGAWVRWIKSLVSLAKMWNIIPLCFKFTVVSSGVKKTIMVQKAPCNKYLIFWCLDPFQEWKWICQKLKWSGSGKNGAHRK